VRKTTCPIRPKKGKKKKKKTPNQNKRKKTKPTKTRFIPSWKKEKKKCDTLIIQ